VDDGLTEEERRDLEQYAAEEEELEYAATGVPDDVNSDRKRLEREPKQTLYCLVRKSQQYDVQIGKPVQKWSLIEGKIPDDEGRIDGLHMV
jgi:hypothetical protein